MCRPGGGVLWPGRQDAWASIIASRTWPFVPGHIPSSLWASVSPSVKSGVGLKR